MNTHVFGPRFMPNLTLAHYINITPAHLLGGYLDFKCSTLYTPIAIFCNGEGFMTAFMLWKIITKPWEKISFQSVPSS